MAVFKKIGSFYRIYFCLDFEDFIIKLLCLFFERVGFPLVKRAQGVTGWQPPEVLPPCGWSIGFFATPLTVGLLFSHLDFPALPQIISL